MKNNFLNEEPELNITPLVDVMLVLIVILMLVIPNLKYDESINLPNGSKTNVSKAKKEDIFVSITNNEIALNKKKYSYISFFDNFALIKNQLDKEKIVYIAGDKDISYDKLMQVLTTFSKAGFVKISLQTK